MLLFTADGGATWRAGEFSARLDPFANGFGGKPCLARSGQGIAVIDGDVFLTADAGASWAPGPAFEWHMGEDGSSSSGDGFQGPVLVCSGDSDLWIVVSGRDRPQEALWHSPDGVWESLSDTAGRDPRSPSIRRFSLSSGSGARIPGGRRRATAAELGRLPSRSSRAVSRGGPAGLRASP